MQTNNFDTKKLLVFLQLTHVTKHEFPKIGNKVFHPYGSPKLISKDWTACKTHSTPVFAYETCFKNCSRKKKFVVKISAKQKQNNGFQHEFPEALFFPQQMGKDHTRPAIGLGEWLKTVAKGWEKRRVGILQPLRGNKTGVPAHHTLKP